MKPVWINKRLGEWHELYPVFPRVFFNFGSPLVMAIGGSTMNEYDAAVIILAIRDLYSMMDKTATSVPPIIMLNVLHMCFPQFSEKNEHGDFSQQVRSILFCSVQFHF